MAVASEAEGWAEALRRIEACRVARAEELDLGGLRLTRVPDEVCELVWLRRLYLGADAEGRKQPYFGYSSEDKKRCNALGALPGALCTALAQLEQLDLAHNGLRGLPAELAALTGLTSLDLGDNAIGDEGARALAALTGLTSLNLAYNRIGDEGARALAALTGLTSLHLAGNAIGAAGARALAALTGLTSLHLAGNAIGAAGARALAALTGLTSLNLAGNAIGDEGARALAALTGLTSLDLAGNAIGAAGARALAALTGLTSLHLAGNAIGAAGARALAALTGLTSLHLAGNAIGAAGARALAALTGLTSLNLAGNAIGDEGARALAALTGLTSLNLAYNRIGDEGARALAALTGLTSLDLAGNAIGAAGARALAALTGLTHLNLGDNAIGDAGARALAALTGLTSLGLGDNRIGDAGARALAALTGLTSLNLKNTGVTDLSPLLHLDRLERLDCSGCHLTDALPELWMKPSLREVILHEATLPGVPVEVLSPNSYTSCLDTLRAHLRDLAAGEAEVADVKFMILGNGRVGKTQLCRRLRGEPYDEAVPSTHGIRIGSAPLARARGGAPLATLRIWDFGGQDIYHGTHALFLKSRAIFPVLWTPASEAQQFHDHAGFTFRNQPLGYWLAYVRAMGSPQSPVLVIQSQCDRPEDERVAPPMAADALEPFPFKKVLHHSARTGRGQAALVEALADAVAWLRERRGPDRIGKGRAVVKARLEAMQEEDAARPPAERRHRLLTQGDFQALCEEAGGVSSPEALLDYLHNVGTVFYRQGLFGDRIVLDQQWALDAVYAAFDRDKCYPNLQRSRGHFTRSDLGRWVWDAAGHGIEEQELFLSLMRQCGICFRLRGAGKGGNAEYIAPDLLPDGEDPRVAALLRKWEGRSAQEAALAYELLPPGLMRALIAEIGELAGVAADYWRDGFAFYDEETRAEVLVAQRWTSGWAGEIRIATRDGQADALLARVLRLVDRLSERFGARPTTRRVPDEGRPPEPGEMRQGADARPPFRPALPPAAGEEYCVSYAWGDDDSPEGRDREAHVDRLCAEAEARGFVIVRDKTAMRYGDSISEFARRIGRAKRVFIFLSNEYLRSAYCMGELHEVWRCCRQDGGEFIARTRVYVLPCARIKTPADRAVYAIHWRQRFEGLDAIVGQHGQFALADADNADYRRMVHWVTDTANILKLVQDTLRPRSFEEFLKWGFEDPPAR